MNSPVFMQNVSFPRHIRIFDIFADLFSSVHSERPNPLAYLGPFNIPLSVENLPIVNAKQEGFKSDESPAELLNQLDVFPPARRTAVVIVISKKKVPADASRSSRSEILTHLKYLRLSTEDVKMTSH